MSFGSYKQYDTRWGNKNYNGSSTVSQAGCGALSCANILHAVNSSITPFDTIKYMQTHGDANHKTFAIYGNGTAWNGIPSCLKYFGLQDVQEVNVASSMDKVWQLMSKGYVGVFLFSAGSRGGVTWTTGGHYIAVSGYRLESSKHYLKTIDSGGRNHDGWYAYETTMKGLVPKVWLGRIEAYEPFSKKPIGKFNCEIPQPVLKLGNKGAEVKKLQIFLNLYMKAILSAEEYKKNMLNEDGSMGNKTERVFIRFQLTEGLTHDGIYGNASRNVVAKYVVKSKQGVGGRKLIDTLETDTILTLATDMVGQSLVVVDDAHRYVFYSRRDGTKQRCKCYDAVDLVGVKANYSTLGHANGATCDADNFYVCSYNGNKNTKKISVISKKTFDKVRTLTAKVALSGIGYDSITDKFVGSKGTNIYVFKDKALKSYSRFSLKFKGGTAQDIFAYNGRVFVCRSYVSGSVSAIDVYNFNGEYVGSYQINANELESADIDKGGYIHYITWNKARLIKTKTRV